MQQRKNTNRGLVSSLAKVRSAVGFDEDRWRELLQLSEIEHARVLAFELELPLRSVIRVAEKFHLSLEILQTGRFDAEALKAHSEGDLEFVPEKYRAVPSCSGEVVLNYLKVVEKRFGNDYRRSILRGVQVREEALKRESSRLDLRLIRDLNQFLTRHGVEEKEFEQLGRSLALESKTAYARELSSCRRLSEVYERYFSDVVQHHWRHAEHRIVKLSDRFCLVETTLLPEIRKAMGGELDENFCALQGGVMAAIPAALGLPQIDVVEESCTTRGAMSCLYRLDFSRALAI